MKTTTLFIFNRALRTMSSVACLICSIPALAGINIMTNGPSTSGAANWSLASAPTASTNSGSFQDLVFQPANTNNITQAAGNLYSQSLNVTNGGSYSIVANNSLNPPTNSVIRPGYNNSGSPTNFVNEISGRTNDLFYLANNSSLAIRATNFLTGGGVTVPLQQAGFFNVKSGSTLTIDAVISGSSSKTITLIGGGTTVFGGANTYIGNTTVSNGSTLMLSGTISNSSANAITVISNGVLNETVTGAIKGDIPLTLTDGSIILSGTNTYSGITKLTDKMQVFGAAALSPNSVLNSGGSTGDNSELNLGSADSGYAMSALSVGGIMRFTGPASGSATLTFAGASAQGFTGGAATKKISAATNVTVVINGTSFDLLGASATTNRNHTLQADGALTFNAAVIATGSSFTAGFTKTGSGVLTLNASNSYNGDTIINAGRLALGAGGSINNSSNVVIAGGATFDVSATGGFTVTSGHSLQSSSPGGIINGSVNASAGAMLLASFTNNSKPSLTISNTGTMTLAAGTSFTVNTANGGAGLTAGNYKLIAKGGSGTVAGTAPSSVTVGGDGLAGGASASLSISGGELYLVVTGGGAPTLGVSKSGSTLTFTWSDASYHLQSQTNTINVGLSTNWADYPGGGTSPVNVTIAPVNPTVFFRLSQ